VRGTRKKASSIRGKSRGSARHYMNGGRRWTPRVGVLTKKPFEPCRGAKGRKKSGPAGWRSGLETKTEGGKEIEPGGAKKGALPVP